MLIFIGIASSYISNGVRPHFNAHPFRVLQSSTIPRVCATSCRPPHPSVDAKSVDCRENNLPSPGFATLLVTRGRCLHLHVLYEPCGRRSVRASGQGLSRCHLPASCRKIEKLGSGRVTPLADAQRTHPAWSKVVAQPKVRWVVVTRWEVGKQKKKGTTY